MYLIVQSRFQKLSMVLSFLSCITILAFLHLQRFSWNIFKVENVKNVYKQIFTASRSATLKGFIFSIFISALQHSHSFSSFYSLLFSCLLAMKSQDFHFYLFKEQMISRKTSYAIIVTLEKALILRGWKRRFFIVILWIGESLKIYLVFNQKNGKFFLIFSDLKELLTCNFTISIQVTKLCGNNWSYLFAF